MFGHATFCSKHLQDLLRIGLPCMYKEGPIIYQRIADLQSILVYYEAISHFPSSRWWLGEYSIHQDVRLELCCLNDASEGGIPTKEASLEKINDNHKYTR